MMLRLTLTLFLCSAAATAQSGTPLLSVNCGGQSYTASDGTSWSADQYYDGGDLAYTGYSISGTQDLYLYRTARRGLYGDFSYTIPIANGSYLLRLLFAETEFGSKGQRVFNVAVNGTPVLTNFDILQEVPSLTPDDKNLPVTVTGGSLRIDVTGVTGRGLLNGIQILPASAPQPGLGLSTTSLAFSATAGGTGPASQTVTVSNTGGGTLAWSVASSQQWLTVSPGSGSGNGTLVASVNPAGLAAGTYSAGILVNAPGANPSLATVSVSFTVSSAGAPPPPPPSGGATALNLNCGGQAFTGADGANWSGDQYYTGGDLLYSGSTINGTQDLQLYRSARRGLYADFKYTLPVANGSYTLVLKFAELAFGSRGQRVFNVVVNGSTVLSNFDILAEVPPLTADDKRFPVTVTNGILEIDVNGVVGFGLLNGIQVIAAGAPPATGSPALATGPGSLSFSANAGGGNPAAQILNVWNAGTGTLGWTASKTQSWLSIAPASGSNSGSITVQANAAGVGPGTYTDNITVSAPGANPSTGSIPVTFTVAAPASPGPPPALATAPGSFSFSATSNGANPAAQTLNVWNSGSGTLTWTASKTQSWLSIAPASGSNSGSITVQANAAGVGPGTYTDNITVSAPGANPSAGHIPVTFTVSASNGIPPPAGTPLTSINAGGQAFSGADGINWLADQYYTGGDVLYSGSLINGTADLSLYRSARYGLYGDFSYSIPIANGSYIVKLRFAELQFGSRGQRVFNVLANGLAVLTNFDILNEVAPFTADDKQFNTTVGNGVLEIDIQGVVGYGIVNGIQIFPASGGSTPPPPPSPPSASGNFGGNSANTDQWSLNSNPPQTIDPNGGPVLYNGIQLPASWPPLGPATQDYRVPPYLVNPPAVIPIDTGRQLFVDDFLIAQTNLTRVQHQPVFYNGNPVIAPGGQGKDNNNLALVYSDGVWFDPADNLYKMWYDGGNGNDLCYAYSTDGLTWTKPSIPDAAVANSNMVLQLGGGRDSTTVWMDLHDDPSRKFKLFSYFPDNNNSLLGIYFSPDGIHWSGRQPYTPNSLSDRTTIFRNPFRNVWVESARSGVTLPASAHKNPHGARARYYSESTDLVNWNPANPHDSFWAGPDDRDLAYPGSTQPPELYNLDATPYESLMVGLFSWYYPADGPDLVELGVGFSRDGFYWSRPTRGGGPGNALIPASNQAGAWNGFNTQSAGGGFLVVGDRLYFYFSGRDSRHNQENASTRRSTGLAVLRRDGFYSMDAGGGTGTLTTRKLRFSGSHLFVNVAAPSGQLQAEVLDSNGNVIPQFARSNSSTAATDSTRQEVTWSGASLGSLAGQTVQFRFYLSNGELYSFWVTSSATGASNGYVAAGGPGFTSDIDR